MKKYALLLMFLGMMGCSQNDHLKIGDTRCGVGTLRGIKVKILSAFKENDDYFVVAKIMEDDQGRMTGGMALVTESSVLMATTSCRI